MMSSNRHLAFLRHIKSTHLPKQITLGSDCSGIEAPVQALKLLGVKVNHAYSCDNDPIVRQSIEANYNPRRIYPDIMERNHRILPHVDLYVAGFPCQTFSMLGKRAGFEDQTKGTIFFECYTTIRLTQPKAFILENVRGLLSHDKGQTFAIILEHLESLGNYHVYHHIYNTLDYGLPQNRERVYIVGLHKHHFHPGFTKPAPLPLEIRVEDIIDHRIGRDTSYGVITQHKLNVLGDLVRAGKIDSLDEPWCVNLNVSSAIRTTPMRDVCPCLLAGNGGDCIYYYTPIRRRLTPREYLRLQGFSDDFTQVIKDGKMYKQAGNSMSTNVLCAIYSEIYRHVIRR